MKTRNLGLALCCASVLASCTDDNPVSNSDNKEDAHADQMYDVEYLNSLFK